MQREIWRENPEVRPCMKICGEEENFFHNFNKVFSVKEGFGQKRNTSGELKIIMPKQIMRKRPDELKIGLRIPFNVAPRLRKAQHLNFFGNKNILQIKPPVK